MACAADSSAFDGAFSEIALATSAKRAPLVLLDLKQLASPLIQRVQKYVKEGCIPYVAADHITAFKAGAGFGAEELGKQARLLCERALRDKGAVVLQGMPTTTPEACEAFVRGLGYTTLPYEPYGQKRTKIGNLDAATNVPAAELLPLHSEMAYYPVPARKVILLCLRTAPSGGESLLGNNADIAAALPAHILERFEANGGVRYTRTYASAAAAGAQDSASTSATVTWQARTGCHDRAGAEAHFAGLGLSTCWEGDTLLASNVLPAVVLHPDMGVPLWFNIAHLAQPGSDFITYGNGQAIEDEVLDAVEKARAEAMRALALGAGDALMLDNYLCMHGRTAYEGTGRSVVTVLTSD